uniref:MULE transposase domain-containing protein n=1 Tax=Amphimedon queenslandica TaxID=400682 RepID=A0A1X7TBH7_AMPQE
MHPHVKHVLDSICLKARQHMKGYGPTRSWKLEQGCYLFRCSLADERKFQSQLYLHCQKLYDRCLLYYHHICQKGKDNLRDEILYPGTSKLAEGYGANDVLSLVKADGINLECHIQDGDSTAKNAVSKHFPQCNLLRCSNHVAKNHAKKLRKQKSMIRDDDKEILCYCPKGIKHHVNCACFSEDFIRKAKSSFQMCLTNNAGKDPNAFVETIVNLALYHYRGIHQWDGSQCDFHPLVVCSCGFCKDKNDVKCSGKPYKTSHKLDSPFHSHAHQLKQPLFQVS